MITWIITEAVMLIAMIFLVQLYTSKSFELDVRSSLSRQINSLSDAIVEENNDLVIDENKIEKNYSNMYVAIINYNGKVEWGSTPEGSSVDGKRSIAPKEITADGCVYYYIDRDIEHTMSQNEFVRAYVAKDDIMLRYLPFKLLAYGAMLLFFIIISLVMRCVFKRFKRSVDIMQSAVEKIGVSRDFDHRMNPDEHYSEIASLIEAENRMLDRMSEILAQQEQFSSDVAHELRTPISVIKAQSQYMLKSAELNDEERKSFGVILRHSNKMQSLVSTLLELSRLDLKETGIESELVDLNEIACAVCEAEQEKSDENPVKFLIKTADSAETKGDISLVTIAVTNLITNAVKFSPEGGSVSVETGSDGDSVFVRVSDNGIGMSEEEQKQIFTRFFKSDSSRNSSGYGLGMPIAKKIAEKHGGTITVQSELNKGSSFTLMLPKL